MSHRLDKGSLEIWVGCQETSERGDTFQCRSRLSHGPPGRTSERRG